MYEFTHKGYGFRWSALDAQEKLLAVASSACSVLAVVPLTAWMASNSYHWGYFVGSRGHWPDRPIPPLEPWAAWWLIGFGVLSGLIWWRFSALQDELFNRIQNWSLASGGIFTALCVTIWGMFTQAGAAYPMPAIAPLVIFTFAVLAFWGVAVRKWG